MEKDFTIVQNYLTVSTKLSFSTENFIRAIQFFKTEISKNKSTIKNGEKIYNVVNNNNYSLPLFVSSKPITRWEKFAKQKGIQKKNKSRREYNEETQAWEFKYGSQSVKNKKLKFGIIEGNKSISQLKREKQKRIIKNKNQHRQNLQRK